MDSYHLFEMWRPAADKNLFSLTWTAFLQ